MEKDMKPSLYLLKAPVNHGIPPEALMCLTCESRNEIPVKSPFQLMDPDKMTLYEGFYLERHRLSTLHIDSFQD